ncbi:MAG: hypothetical protein LBH55_01925 [Mycoplasmataceae bacterium]|jgi:DNA polymerase III sliding clamp (beta) subunit (PCNA family)|nr:hypothetical protein [Mycoplasmataceae bacterium]
MLIIINNNKLSNLLKKVKNITTDKDSNNKIYSYVKISAYDGVLTLEVLNSIFSAKICSNDLKISKEGSIIIDANLIYELISKLSADLDTTIENVDTAKLLIKNGKFSGNVNTIVNCEFPDINYEPASQNGSFELSKKTFEHLITHVVPFSLTNQLKQETKDCILIDSTRVENKIEFAATDTFQLAYLVEDFNGPKFRKIIDCEIIKMINNLFNTEKIKLFLEENSIVVISENLKLLCKLNSSKTQFPQINLVDNKSDFDVIVKKTNLLNALELCSIINLKDAFSKIDLTFTRNNLLISSKNIENGSTENNIEINCQLENFAFNIVNKTLTNVIKSILSDNIVFKFNNAKPKIVFICDEKNSSYKYFIAVNVTSPLKN